MEGLGPRVHSVNAWDHTMRITLNGNPTELEQPTTISGLLEKLAIDPTRAVVERNGSIVERAHLGEAALAEGDRVEIVRFVGGG